MAQDSDDINLNASSLPPPTIPRPLSDSIPPKTHRQPITSNLPSPQQRPVQSHHGSGLHVDTRPFPSISPSRPSSVQMMSPTKMSPDEMEQRVRAQRLNSLDQLVQDQIADHSDAEMDEGGEREMKTTATKNREEYSLEAYKLIALINGGSGAKKGWILAQELKKFGASVYNLTDLCVSETVRAEMGLELQRNNGRSIMLICGGDGTQAWACSLIDASIGTLSSPIPFPSICVFPMGTGNDLSRVIGWGSLEPNHKNIIQRVADIHFCAKITKRWSDLDRWRITYTFDHIQETEHEFCSQLMTLNHEEHKENGNESVNGHGNSNGNGNGNTPNVNISGLLKDRTGGGKQRRKGDLKKSSDIDQDSDDFMGEDMMDTIMNDIDCNAEELASSSYKPSATVEQLNKLFEYAPHEMGGKRRYEIEPPEQYYIQQHPKSKTYQHIQTFDPPLPSSFVE